MKGHELDERFELAEDGREAVLYRPVGQAEFDLIEASGWRSFPPRIEGQPIFYPVLNEEYATMIARQWNTKDPNSGYVGYVLRFRVDVAVLAEYEVHVVGGSVCQELWVPAENLASFNSGIHPPIEVIAEYRPALTPDGS